MTTAISVRLPEELSKQLDNIVKETEIAVAVMALALGRKPGSPFVKQAAAASQILLCSIGVIFATGLTFRLLPEYASLPIFPRLQLVPFLPCHSGRPLYRLCLPHEEF